MKYTRFRVILLCPALWLQIYNVCAMAQVPFLNEDYLELVFDKDEKTEGDSHTALWVNGYMRTANKAYMAHRCTVPLSVLFFGQSCFPLRYAFADSSVSVPSNVWINLSNICPVIEHSEKGMQIGLEYGHDILVRDHTMRVGIRGLLPVKSLCNTRCYTSYDAQTEAGGINQVRSLSTEVVRGPEGKSTVDNSFAYRLDFLSSLSLVDNKNIPLISYSLVPLTMNQDIDVTYNKESPIHLIRRSDGRVPSTPFAAAESDVLATPFLPADGSAAFGDSERGQFSGSYSYGPLATDMNNQAQYWVVPTVKWLDPSYHLSDSAYTLRGVIENLVNYQIDNSIMDYFSDKNIDFNTYSCRGIGDLDAQLFALWSWPESMVWTELNCSFVFPTGKRVLNPLVLLAQPLGNNGHVEIGPGLEVGGYLARWCSLRGALSYSWVLCARECVAAAFKGACVKNIGPATPAYISWRYFNFTFDFNITEPHWHQFGINLAYNLYCKTRDCVAFTSATALDFDGAAQTLDPCLLSCSTHVVSNKLQGELFWSSSFGAIYGGFSYVVSGKNVPVENMVYIGLGIEF